MKINQAFTVLSVSAALLLILGIPDALARGVRGGGRSSSAGGSYGSVRQSSYHSGSDQTDRREVAGSEDHIPRGEGTASFGGGQARWNREEAAPEKDPSVALGKTFRDDGQRNMNREAAATGAQEPRAAARVGSTISTLPAGCRRVTAGGDSYYYHEGYCYKPVYVDDKSTYTVVLPPEGVVVYDLPDGVTVEEEQGVTYYVYNGTYYRRTFVNGQVGYVVVPAPSQ